jgi:hypothetical protein
MVNTEPWSLVEIVLLQGQHGVSMYRGWVAAKVVKVGWSLEHGNENTARRGFTLTQLGSFMATVNNSCKIRPSDPDRTKRCLECCERSFHCRSAA